MSEKVENNWYEILELDFYLDPKEDEQKIKKIIEEKNKCWVRNQRDRKIGMLCTKYIEYNKKGKILKDILDDEKRSQMIKDVQRRLFEEVDGFLAAFEGGVVTEEKVRYILGKMREENIVINEKIIKERIFSKGKKIGIGSYEEFDINLKKTFDVNLFSKFEDIKKTLDKLGEVNIYSFFYFQGLALNFLTKREIELKIEYFEKKNDFESGLKRKIFSFCKELIEKDEVEKYNEYLEKMEYLKIKREMDFLINEKKKLTKKRMESEIASFEEKFGGVIEKRNVREFFSKYFGYEIVDNENERKFSGKAVSKINGRKKFQVRTLFAVFLGIFCSFSAVFLWNWYYNKQGAEETASQESNNYEKKVNLGKEKANNSGVKISQKDFRPENNLSLDSNIKNKENKKENEKKVVQNGSVSVANNSVLQFQEKNLKKEKERKVSQSKNVIEKNNLNSHSESKKGSKIKELEKSVEGDAVKMTDLGESYESQGNKIKAKEWYEKAAQLGNARAKNNLGNLYRETDE